MEKIMSAEFNNSIHNDNIRKAVRKQYGKVAESNNQNIGCSVSSCCNDSATATSTSLALSYTKEQLLNIPDGENMGLGCGNPHTIASLKTGETVLDLGSGGGFDCFLAAREVGKTGQIIGVDMTPEMVSKARHNLDKTTFKNIDFRLGEIENLPIADDVIDVIISNCVILKALYALVILKLKNKLLNFNELTCQ
jgi:SAM-dependent methyltransferase